MNFSVVKSTRTKLEQEVSAYISKQRSSQYIYLIAGVHGNEPEGVYVLDQLFTWLKTTKLSLPMIVVPIVNPDGLAAKTRANANAVDLNRNFPTRDWTPTATDNKYNPGPAPLSEIENKFIMELFDEYKPGLIISFHSWKPLLNCNTAARSEAEFLAKYNEYVVVEDIGYPTPGSLGTYVDEVLKCKIITYELPEIKSGVILDQIWQQNEQALQELLISLNTTKRGDHA